MIPDGQTVCGPAYTDDGDACWSACSSCEEAVANDCMDYADCDMAWEENEAVAHYCCFDCAYSYGANDAIESCCFESYSYEARVPQGMFPAGDAPANYEVGGGWSEWRGRQGDRPLRTQRNGHVREPRALRRGRPRTLPGQQ